MKQTSLTPLHAELGARLVDFAGWRMPVQYTGILAEAETVRSRCGLFDLGHMGRIAVRGPDSEAFLQRLQTNDAAQIRPGRIRYALILDDQAHTQDDILVYREPDDSGFFVVVNASNCERDLAIMRQLATGHSVEITDLTGTLGMIALQGPRSEPILAGLTEVDLGRLGYYAWARGEVAGVPAAISRTGYTGEDGFEVYLDDAATPGLWRRLVEAGASPCGLGARDILRLEAGMALYGHELDETTGPDEAGLSWAVKLTHDFVGRTALEALRARGGTGRRLVGITTTSRRVPRQGHTLHAGDVQVGAVCSGGASPTLGTNIATAYVRDEWAEPGTALEFSIRDRREPAVVASLPFYQRQK